MNCQEKLTTLGIYVGSRLRNAQTRLLYYFWKFSSGLIKYELKYMNDDEGNKIFEADPHISDIFQGIEFNKLSAKELQNAHDRFNDVSYCPAEPLVMTSHQLYKLFSATHVGLNVTNEGGWLSFACMCNSDDAKFDKHLDCIAVKLNHDLQMIDYILLRGNHIISELDDDRSKNARLLASIAYFHFIGIHSHNYVHFHLSSAFAVAVKEGNLKKSLTRKCLETHVKYNLLTNQNGLGGAVSDGKETNFLFRPITPVSMDVSVFNAAAVNRTYLFFDSKPDPDVSLTHKMLSFHKNTKRRLCFGFPFTYDGTKLNELTRIRKIPIYAKVLGQYYEAYYEYFTSILDQLDRNELARIQIRIGELCGSLAKHEILSASTAHFFATLIFISGSFHSTDHGICNGIVKKHNIPMFAVSEYSAEAKLWNRESLVISENFTKMAIDNVGADFYETIGHRQDLLKGINGIRNHDFALNQLNDALNVSKQELVDYLEIQNFHIYPSIAH
jgi:hypothetical protein